MAKSFTTIMLDKDLVSRMRELKERVEGWTDRSMSWGAFIGMLLAVYEARGEPSVRGTSVAEMQRGVPMTEEELHEAGFESFPGLPVTLNERDKERIAEMVAEKISESSVSKKRTERRQKWGQK